MIAFPEARGAVEWTVILQLALLKYASMLMLAKHAWSSIPYVAISGQLAFMACQLKLSGIID